MRRVHSSGYVSFLFLLFTSALAAQVYHRETQLAFSDNQGNSDTLIIGVDDRATRGIDEVLGEFEAPPLPPSGFDVRLVSNRPGETVLGVGVRIDFLPRPSTPEEKDTFVVRFQNTDVADANFRVTWDPDLVGREWDSMQIRIPAFIDGDGTTVTPARSVDMASVDSLDLINPQAYNVGKISIWKYGYRWCCGVNPEPGPRPVEYALRDASPNPFNPSTTIRFQLPVRSRIVLTVHDCLGREVATVAEGRFEAGRYAVAFNGNGLASGVYYFRLVAGNFTMSRKMVLMK